jgi:tryptophan 2-monooxygenase
MRFFSFNNKRDSHKHPKKDRTISPSKPPFNSHFVKRQTSKIGEQKVRPQAWVDTPQIVYSAWNQAAGDIDQPLGTLPPNFSVALVGGGITNVVLAFNLVKAGADVTLIEATDDVGGHLRTIQTPDRVNVAEMGAMRFPPSEDLLYYYANEFNYSFRTSLIQAKFPLSSSTKKLLPLGSVRTSLFRASRKLATAGAL